MRPLKKPPTLERKTFAVSRLAEFASAPELTKQIGHPLEHWPAVIFKEIVDNAIDAAEEKGEAPVVVVSVDEEFDHGSGRGARHRARRRQEPDRLHKADLEPRPLREPEPRAAGQRATVDHPDGLRARRRG